MSVFGLLEYIHISISDFKVASLELIFFKLACKCKNRYCRYAKTIHISDIESVKILIYFKADSLDAWHIFYKF